MPSQANDFKFILQKIKLQLANTLAQQNMN